jgi:hypothetical protein
MVRRLATVYRGPKVLDHTLEGPMAILTPPTPNVRALEPLVQQAKVVGDHRPKFDQATVHIPSRIG